MSGDGPNWDEFLVKAQRAGLDKAALGRITEEDKRKDLLVKFQVGPKHMSTCLSNWNSLPKPTDQEVKKAQKRAAEQESCRTLNAPIVESFEGSGRKVLLLPQQETQPDYFRRLAQLERMRVEYQFEHYPGDILPPYCRELPEREKSDARDDHNDAMVFDVVGSYVKLGFRKVTDTIGDFFRRAEGPFQDYRDLYGKDKAPLLPAVADRWQEDIEFARQRLQGFIPLLIERVDGALPTKFGLKNDDIKGVVEDGATIESLIRDKRLYIVDYSMCAGVSKIAPPENNFVEPIAAFYITKKRPAGSDDCCLMPLAIQLYQDPKLGPVFTPKDDEGDKNLWLAAKIHTQCTEACWHEVPAHLLTTHLIMESVFVAMMRTVSTRHPINELISAHFWYTLNINKSARENLMGRGGVVPKVMSMGYAGMMELAGRAWRDFRFSSYIVPEELASRRVDDIPHYHYRDDSVRVWNTIKTYVSGILDNFYPGRDIDVQRDTELQDWVQMVLDKEFGVGAQGTPFVNGKAETLDQVKLFCTEIIWACSAFHAVLNNGQYDYLGYVPNVPGIFKIKPPTKKDKGFTKKEIAEAMPSYGYASEQIAFLHLLSMSTDQPLGQFSHKKKFMQGHDRAQAVLKEFQSNLAALSKDIQQRNASLTVPYPYLDPSQIASGVAI